LCQVSRLLTNWNAGPMSMLRAVDGFALSVECGSRYAVGRSLFCALCDRSVDGGASCRFALMTDSAALSMYSAALWSGFGSLQSVFISIFSGIFSSCIFCFSSTASKDDHADAGVCPMRTKCDLITVVISVPHVFTTSTISYIGFAISQFTEKAISSANTKHYRC